MLKSAQLRWGCGTHLASRRGIDPNVLLDRYLYGLPGPPCPAALTAARTLIQSSVLLASAVAQGDVSSAKDARAPTRGRVAHKHGKVCAQPLLVSDIRKISFEQSGDGCRVTRPRMHETKWEPCTKGGFLTVITGIDLQCGLES